MGKTTDTLIEHSLKACGGKTSRRDLDEILSMGERTSTRLFTAALRAHGIEARIFDPSDSSWPIITDDEFGNANPLLGECAPRIRSTITPLLEKGVVPVVPGFVGKTLRGEVTTLGRGGSDTTAFILARAVGAEEVVIVTDVDGVMTADPKVVSNPRKMEKIDVRKLANLCDSGVKFLHRKALKYLDGSFKVRIVNHNSKGLNDEGTVIHGSFPEDTTLTGCDSSVAMITIVGEGLVNNPKVLSNMVKEVSRHRIPILAWSAALDSICVYIPEAKVNEAAEAFHSMIKNEEGLAMAVRRNMAFIRIFGVETERIPYFWKRVSELLERRGVNAFLASTIASNVLIFVEWAYKDTALSVVREVLGRVGR